jgi:hypothetical protein
MVTSWTTESFAFLGLTAVNAVSTEDGTAAMKTAGARDVGEELTAADGPSKAVSPLGYAVSNSDGVLEAFLGAGSADGEVER